MGKIVILPETSHSLFPLISVKHVYNFWRESVPQVLFHSHSFSWSCSSLNWDIEVCKTRCTTWYARLPQQISITPVRCSTYSPLLWKCSITESKLYCVGKLLGVIFHYAPLENNSCLQYYGSRSDLGIHNKAIFFTSYCTEPWIQTKANSWIPESSYCKLNSFAAIVTLHLTGSA